MSELKDKHDLPEVPESGETMQQGEQSNEQPGFEDDGPTPWSESEALSDLSPKVERQDAGDTRTFDRYMEQAKDLDVSTDRDKAVFYSGPDPVWKENPYPNSKGGTEETAMSYAKQTDKMTLDITPGGQWYRSEVKENPNLEEYQKKQIAATLSQRFAEGASGEVVAFSRSDLQNASWKPNAIWTQIERPALERNPNVTKIDEV